LRYEAELLLAAVGLGVGLRVAADVALQFNDFFGGHRLLDPVPARLVELKPRLPEDLVGAEDPDADLALAEDVSLLVSEVGADRAVPVGPREALSGDHRVGDDLGGLLADRPLVVAVAGDLLGEARGALVLGVYRRGVDLVVGDPLGGGGDLVGNDVDDQVAGGADPVAGLAPAVRGGDGGLGDKKVLGAVDVLVATPKAQALLALGLVVGHPRPAALDPLLYGTGDLAGVLLDVILGLSRHSRPPS
jgi:hypothetical protein